MNWRSFNWTWLLQGRFSAISIVKNARWWKKSDRIFKCICFVWQYTANNYSWYSSLFTLAVDHYRRSEKVWICQCSEMSSYVMKLWRQVSAVNLPMEGRTDLTMNIVIQINHKIWDINSIFFQKHKFLSMSCLIIKSIKLKWWQL